MGNMLSQKKRTMAWSVTAGFLVDEAFRGLVGSICITKEQQLA